jgi:hypothetical protein
MKNDLLPGMIVTHIIHGGKYLLLSIQENKFVDYDYNVITFNLRNRIINTWNCVNFDNWKEL